MYHKVNVGRNQPSVRAHDSIVAAPDVDHLFIVFVKYVRAEGERAEGVSHVCAARVDAYNTWVTANMLYFAVDRFEQSVATYRGFFTLG